MSNSPHLNGFISAVDVEHQCGHSPTRVGKISRQKAKKQHRKTLQRFSFLLREEFLNTVKKKKRTSRSYALQIMKQKHNNE